MKHSIIKFTKKYFLRIKWLFKNLKFSQFIKYLFLRKIEVIYIPKEDNTYTKKYKITNICIKDKGTLLIKPSGLCHLKKIINHLDDRQIVIEKAIKIIDYKIFSNNVFYSVSQQEQNIWAFILEKYFYATQSTALLLYINTDIKTTSKIKSYIRKDLGIDFFKVKIGRYKYITSITPIHSSNYKERIYEESVISNMIKENLAKYICIRDLL
ncbi:hypothetical protein [Treponema pedis]|uniref:Uncharacterized protein n=1 Tax=Treponema pedis TaxID=409322 RepID=A0A7S6WPJ6_9SPIR|nr:hypothetical protein [Treponema pedis]QOW60945.1 hypothetical protein IFE08_00510 [Treponema pedis]